MCLFYFNLHMPIVLSCFSSIVIRKNGNSKFDIVIHSDQCSVCTYEELCITFSSILSDKKNYLQLPHKFLHQFKLSSFYIIHSNKYIPQNFPLMIQDLTQCVTCQEKHITVKKEPHESLGMTVAGGRGSKSGELPIFVTSVPPHGCLARDGRIKRGKIGFSIMSPHLPEFNFVHEKICTKFSFKHSLKCPLYM